jgi:uncharacterized membrane protein HdeD (DUF308 family)
MSTRFGGAPATLWARDWRIFLASGIIAVLFGILTLIWPHITLLVLIVLFGIYAIVNGLLSFGRAFSAGERGLSWVWPVLGGVVGIAAGVVAFVWPGLTAVALLFLIGIWAVLSGIAEIIAGIALRHEISNEWLLIVGGVISVLFGFLVLIRPGAGALAIIWLIGLYAIVIGLAHIVLAFRLRDWQQHRMPGGTAGIPPAAA